MDSPVAAHCGDTPSTHAVHICTAAECTRTATSVWAHETRPPLIRTRYGFLHACRVGEAANPGPLACALHSLDDPDDWTWDGAWPEGAPEATMSGVTHEVPENAASCPSIHPDCGLGQEDLALWRAVESELQLSTSWDTHAHAARRPDIAPLAPVGEFLSSRTFVGSIPDYVFTTRDGLTGYYKSSPRGPSNPRTVIVLANVLPCPPTDTWSSAQSLSRRRGARHARLPDGRRRRGRGRRNDPVLTTASWLADGHTDLADNDWRSNGVWTVDTANANAWSTSPAHRGRCHPAPRDSSP